jgi:hypothetical protein
MFLWRQGFSLMVIMGRFCGRFMPLAGSNAEDCYVSVCNKRDRSGAVATGAPPSLLVLG